MAEAENFNGDNFFTEDVLEAIKKAYAFAQQRKYEYVSIDNLMIFIAQTPYGREIFKAMNIDIEDFKDKVTEYLDSNIPKITNGYDKPEMTIQFHRTIEQAAILKRASSPEGKADEGYILTALFELSTQDVYTLIYFDYFEVSRYDVIRFIAHGADKEKKTTNKDKSNEKLNFLEKFAIFLNKKASNNKIDKIIGREEEIDKVISILSQRRKNNPILVGEPGVGKTAIAEGLALRILNKEVPESLENLVVYSLDMPAMVAGTRYRGDFEERLKGVIKEASANPNIVLFIDEIHTLIGTGSGSGTMDASNILKPSLSSGEIKVIGATTYDEYRKYIEKEGALARRFQKVDVAEPTEEQAYQILLGLREQYETFHNVKYTDEALRLAVKQSIRYINDRHLPDKAIDAIDMAGAQAKLKPKKKKVVTITENDINLIIAKIAKVPLSELQESEKFKLKNLEKDLKSEIYGQDEAIYSIVDNVVLARAALTTKTKPIGSFLFAGPSGVGKTELSKQIASNLGIPFIRFDMSEYMEKHNVSRLIGAPPGYVGYEESGQLTEAIRKTPYCVLLLDEIEKAHHDIYNILLQVMDYGVLTDNNGKKADFKNVILIMTSNVGAREINKKAIGFSDKSSETVDNDRSEQIKKLFSPEFYNRLDSIVQFKPLEKESVDRVIEKHLNKLQIQLADKKVVLMYGKDLINFIGDSSFDSNMGARPIERYIEKQISQPLSKEILFGKLEKGGEVKVNIVDNAISFEYVTNYAERVPVISKEVNSEIVENIIKKPRAKKTVK